MFMLVKKKMKTAMVTVLLQLFMTARGDVMRWQGSWVVQGLKWHLHALASPDLSTKRSVSVFGITPASWHSVRGSRDSRTTKLRCDPVPGY